MVDTFRSKSWCPMESDRKPKRQQRPRREFSDEFKAGAVALVLKEGKCITLR